MAALFTDEATVLKAIGTREDVGIAALNGPTETVISGSAAGVAAVVESFEGPMPAMVGWHPWFLRDIDGRGPVTLQFDAETMYVRDTEGMPDGTTQEVTAGPWDDCFTGLKGDPTLTWPDGLTLTLTSTCDHWVVYDEPQDALCIEPQSGPPDAFNLDKTTLATPDAPVEHTMTLRWS